MYPITIMRAMPVSFGLWKLSLNNVSGLTAANSIPQNISSCEANHKRCESALVTWLTYFYLGLQPLSVIRCLELAESNIYRSWINRVWSFLNSDDMRGTVYGPDHPPHTSRHWPQLTCSEHAWATRRQCWPLCLLTNGPPSLLRFRTERIFFLSCFN